MAADLTYYSPYGQATHSLNIRNEGMKRKFAGRPAAANLPAMKEGIIAEKHEGDRMKKKELTDENQRLKQLEEENRKLKLLVVDLSLDKQMLQDVLKKALTTVKK